MATELAVVRIGEANRGGVRPVTYQGDGSVLGHIYPTNGRAVIVAMDDWGVAQYCRDLDAATAWLARNE